MLILDKTSSTPLLTQFLSHYHYPFVLDSEFLKTVVQLALIDLEKYFIGQLISRDLKHQILHSFWQMLHNVVYQRLLTYQLEKEIISRVEVVISPSFNQISLNTNTEGLPSIYKYPFEFKKEQDVSEESLVQNYNLLMERQFQE